MLSQFVIPAVILSRNLLFNSLKSWRLGTQKIRIGFTVENPEKFMEVIKTKGIQIS